MFLSILATINVKYMDIYETLKHDIQQKQSSSRDP